MAETVLITGGTGLVGRHLSQALIKEKYNIRILTRRQTQKSGDIHYFHWDPDNKVLDEDALQGTDHIINLAGRNFNDKRWTDKFKDELYKSRVDATAFLIKQIKETNTPVKTFINASALNYYGYHRESLVTEETSAGNVFPARLCREWEREAMRAKELNIRVVIFRLGVVLASQDSALQKIALPVKLWAGAPIGSGNQYFSWIHIEDLCNMYRFALQNKQVTGVYNAASPDPVTNRAFTGAIASVLKKPMFLPPVPSFVLKTAMGEVANLVLGGIKLSSKKIRNAGFTFKYPDKESALRDLLTTEPSAAENT